MFLEIVVTAAIGLVIGIMCLVRRPAQLWKEDTDSGPGYRRLGAFEVMMARLGKKGECNVSSIIFIRSKFPLTEVNVRKALIALSQRHPLLRMRLGQENGEYTYMKEIEDFRVDLEICVTTDWKGLMEDEVSKIYDTEKGPLWKVKFIPHQTSYEDGEEAGYPHQAACIFGFHHTIADAASFFMLFGEFVNTLQAIQENVEHLVQSMPLLPPVDAYIDNAKIYSPKYNLKVNLIHALGMLSSIVPPIVLKTFFKPALFVKNLGVEIDRNPKAAKQNCFIVAELTRKQTSELLASCKRHNTTVQCVIQTAACLAYAAMADGGQVTHSHNINCRISVNLRRFLASHELNDYFGLYVSSFAMSTNIQPSMSFWDMVSQVAPDLQAKVKSQMPFLYYNVWAILAKMDADSNPLITATADLPGQRNVDLGFHNYGNFNSLNKDENSQCKLSGFFTTAHVISSGPVFGHALATVNGKLSWSFLSCLHICTEEQAQKYADMTLKLLVEAIQE